MATDTLEFEQDETHRPPMLRGRHRDRPQALGDEVVSVRGFAGGGVDHPVACPPKRNSVAAPACPQVVHSRFVMAFPPCYATAHGGHRSARPL